MMAHAELKKAVLFSQQTVGFGARRTGMVHWAHTLAKRGWDTKFVTVQLSWLSKLAGVERLKKIPSSAINAWRDVAPGLSGFVWCPVIHPANFGPRWIDAWMGPLSCALYGPQLPRGILAAIEDADLIVIESCSAVALFETVKRHAPAAARLVYCASDRLQSVHMQPALTGILAQTASDYDLIRIPAQSMASDFPNPENVAHIPHGITKNQFDSAMASPYLSGRKTAIVAGDMKFDHDAFGDIVRDFPDLDIHLFGRMESTAYQSCNNVTVHGEVAFETLVPYIAHADIGIAPYVYEAGLEYLRESSLKLIQYAYCKLPVIAPDFVDNGGSNMFTYGATDIAAAIQRALSCDRSKISRDGILDWEDVIDQVLDKVGL